MKLTVYDKPMAIEELLFRVKPELVDKYVELEYEIWGKSLATIPGFAGSETWVSQTHPGEIKSTLYWTDIEAWKGISYEWLDATEKRLLDIVGAENVELIQEGHKLSQMYKVREYK